MLPEPLRRDQRSNRVGLGDDHSNVVPFRQRVGDGVAAPKGADVRESIGSTLRQERTRQQRTLAEVAAAAAVSLPYLSEVERGRKDVSSDVLIAIAGALGIGIADVFERSADRLRARTRMQRHGSSIQLHAA